jgi:hypothetical protein
MTTSVVSPELLDEIFCAVSRYSRWQRQHDDMAATVFRIASK